LVTDQNGEAVWTSIEDFLNDLTIEAENGITISEDPTTQESIIQLGGILTEENTVIETGGEDNTLAITNLIDITDEVQNEETDLEDYQIMIMNDNGILHTVSPSELINETELEVINGLTQSGEQIKLGGTLIEETVIETDEENTLAIEGLQTAENENKILIIEKDNNTLKTVERSLEEDISSDQSIADLTDYSPYIQEVYIGIDIADLSNNGMDIILPNAMEAKGQVINIKLSEGEEADNYLNIKDSGTEIGYGALP